MISSELLNNSIVIKSNKKRRKQYMNPLKSLTNTSDSITTSTANVSLMKV